MNNVLNALLAESRRDDLLTEAARAALVREARGAIAQPGKGWHRSRPVRVVHSGFVPRRRRRAGTASHARAAGRGPALAACATTRAAAE